MAEPATAIVLARAGSKGLPGKNRILITGKPCWLWTVEAAKAARSIGRIVFSTDDPEIPPLARTMDVEIVARPPDLAADNAPIDEAARHAVRAIEGDSPLTGPIVILYANVPVRPGGLIDAAVDLLRKTGCDSVQSYSPVGKHHPWWTVQLDDNGAVRAFDGHKQLYHGVYRRQDLPPAYIPDGGVIALTRRALFLDIPGVPRGPHAFLGADHRGVVSDGPVVDIDTLIDAQVAEAILKEHNG